jgi:hypothetical protein
MKTTENTALLKLASEIDKLADAIEKDTKQTKLASLGDTHYSYGTVSTSVAPSALDAFTAFCLQ